MGLPKTESVFDFDFISDMGQRYEGRFTVLAVLDLGQKHRLELEKTRLLGNYQNPSDGLVAISTVLASLRTKIVDAPEWWKQSNGGFNLLEEDLIMALYKKVLESEEEWKLKLKEMGKKAQEERAASQSTSQ